MWNIEEINKEIDDTVNGRLNRNAISYLADLLAVRDELMCEEKDEYDFGTNYNDSEIRSKSYKARVSAKSPTTDEWDLEIHADEIPSMNKSYNVTGTPMLTKEMAMEWAKHMQNEDGTTGPHWSMDQIKQVMAQKGIEEDPLKFYLAMNATYSDLCKVFKKYGIGNKIDTYIDFAKAFWLNDVDAVPNKLAAYYENVVKH